MWNHDEQNPETAPEHTTALILRTAAVPLDTWSYKKEKIFKKIKKWRNSRKIRLQEPWQFINLQGMDGIVIIYIGQIMFNNKCYYYATDQPILRDYYPDEF